MKIIKLIIVILVGFFLVVLLYSNKKGDSKIPEVEPASTIVQKIEPEVISKQIQSGDSWDYTFAEDFEAQTKYGTGFWKTKQLQRGSMALVDDPQGSSNRTALFRAGNKSFKVGKAALIKKVDPITHGDELTVTARFYFPSESPLDSVILIDKECSICGLDTNPGMRLYVRDARLRLDPSKIGYKESINQNVEHKLELDRWHTVVWRSVLGTGSKGIDQVFVDGVMVIDSQHTNVITQEIADAYNLMLTGEYIDTVQIGITANSNSKTTELLVDDVLIQVK